MTRAEAKKFNWFMTDRDGIEKHIDKIYDDFASGLKMSSRATCEECGASMSLLREDFFDAYVCSKCGNTLETRRL